MDFSALNTPDGFGGEGVVAVDSVTSPIVPQGAAES
jgi:hypothetical protein